MLTSIDVYVLRRLFGTFMPTLIGTSFLLFLGGTFRLVKDEDMSLAQITLALPWVLPYLLPALIPLAYAVTLTLVLGRMVADNEVIAFNALGVSWRALYRPCLLFAAGLSVCTLALQVSVVPYSHQMRKDADAATYLRLTHAGQGEHLSRVFTSQGLFVYARRYGPDGLDGVVLHADSFWGSNDEAARRTFHMTARHGELGVDPETNALLLAMQDVTVTVEGGAVVTPIRMHLERFVQRLTLGGWRRIKVSDYSSAQLRQTVNTQAQLNRMAAAVGGITGAGRGRWVTRRFEAFLELHQRIALSVAPLVLAAFVAPLTILLRARSALVPFAAGLGLGSLVYFAPSLLGQTLAESTARPPFVYLGGAVTLAAAALAVRAANRR